METKKVKLEITASSNVDKPQIELVNLIDDCIFEIFEYLSLDDLCSISETCKHLRNLAVEYFPQKYHKKWLRISESSEQIRLLPDEKYVRHFRRAFVNISVELPCDNNGMKLQTFLQTNCNETMKKIHLHGARLPQSFGDGIANVLKNVETVAFSGCHLNQGDSYFENICKHCPELNELIVLGSHDVGDLFLRQFPKLEHINLQFRDDDINVDNIKKFFERHPNIRRLTCNFSGMNFNARKECLKCVADCAAGHVKQISVSLEHGSDLTDFSKEFQMLCCRENVERLELTIDTVNEYFLRNVTLENVVGHRLKELNSLRKLKGLHLNFVEDYFTLPKLFSLPDLQVITLNFNASEVKSRFLNECYLDDIEDGFMPEPDDDVNAILDLPNLQDLYIFKSNNSNFIKPFVRQAPNLKRIFLVDCGFEVHYLNVINLNAQRQNLSSACELTIYADKSATFSLESEASTKLDLELIRVKLVKFYFDKFHIDHSSIHCSIVKD